MFDKLRIISDNPCYIFDSSTGQYHWDASSHLFPGPVEKFQTKMYNQLKSEMTNNPNLSVASIMYVEPYLDQFIETLPWPIKTGLITDRPWTYVCHSQYFDQIQEYRRHHGILDSFCVSNDPETFIFCTNKPIDRSNNWSNIWLKDSYWSGLWILCPHNHPFYQKFINK